MSRIRWIHPLLMCVALSGCHIQIAFRPADSVDERLVHDLAPEGPSRQARKTQSQIASSEPKTKIEKRAGGERKTPRIAGWQPTGDVALKKVTPVEFAEASGTTRGQDTSNAPTVPRRFDSNVSPTREVAQRSAVAPAIGAVAAPELGSMGENEVLDAADMQYPIDFPTVLRLAGAENWDIQLAAERVNEAHVNLDAAKALWLPSLTAGIGYTKHEGRIQDTRGSVIEVSRNALFVGGGGHVGNAPMTGGAGGPARLFVDLSVTDAIYEPLVARQLTGVAHARHSAAYNDTLQEASLAYYELIRSQGRLANALTDLDNADLLVRLTTAFVASGKGSRADTARVQTELTTRKQQVVEAELAIKVASAQLARVLRLNAETVLFSLDATALPVDLIAEQVPLDELVTRGQQLRPEVAESLYQLEANCQRVQAERMRPFIPNVYMGVSSGGFGGGVNDRLSQLDGRADFDIGAVWELRNLGLGTRAARKRSRSQYRQSLFDVHRIRDAVTAEITQTYHTVQAQRRRIELAESNVQEAGESLQQNLARIRGLEGLPLEALQAIQAVARANNDYLNAVVAYNRAQVQLLRATGRPVESVELTTPVVDTTGLSVEPSAHSAVHETAAAERPAP